MTKLFGAIRIAGKESKISASFWRNFHVSKNKTKKNLLSKQITSRFFGAMDSF
jgi:hypothetical protein